MENLDRQEICKNIKTRIANLSQNEIEEIFKIIYKNNNNYSKNNNYLESSKQDKANIIKKT